MIEYELLFSVKFLQHDVAGDLFRLRYILAVLHHYFGIDHLVKQGNIWGYHVVVSEVELARLTKNSQALFVLASFTKIDSRDESDTTL